MQTTVLEYPTISVTVFNATIDIENNNSTMKFVFSWIQFPCRIDIAISH